MEKPCFTCSGPFPEATPSSPFWSHSACRRPRLRINSAVFCFQENQTFLKREVPGRAHATAAVITARAHVGGVAACAHTVVASHQTHRQLVARHVHYNLFGPSRIPGRRSVAMATKQGQGHASMSGRNVAQTGPKMF